MRRIKYKLALILIIASKVSARGGYTVTEKNQSNPPAPPEFTLTPTTKPSSSPSMNPLSFPSTSPSSSPSISSFPSSSPSSSPSISSMPSSMPSVSPSILPSVTPKCVTDSDGSFGTTTGSPLLINFIYEADTSFTIVNESFILSNVENAINNAILSSVFADCPSSGGTTRKLLERTGSVRRRENEALENIVGFSSSPLDEIDDTATCSATTTGTTCLQVEGRFHLYTLSSPDDSITDVTSEYVHELLKVLTKNKSSELYFWLDESITEIRYIDPSPPAIVSNAETLENPGGGASHMWIGLAAGAGTLLIAGAFFAWRRRRKSEEEDKLSEKYVTETCTYDTTTILDQDGNEIHSISSSSSNSPWFGHNRWKKSYDVNLDDEGNLETFVL